MKGNKVSSTTKDRIDNLLPPEIAIAEATVYFVEEAIIQVDNLAPEDMAEYLRAGFVSRGFLTEKQFNRKWHKILATQQPETFRRLCKSRLADMHRSLALSLLKY